MGSRQQKIEKLAEICHEANRFYCETLGDYSQPKWEDAEFWQKESAMDGVRKLLEDPYSTSRDIHKRWMEQKEKDGWKYGPEKDVEAKTHPCMVDYDDLPESQKVKDDIFKSIVLCRAFK